MKYIFWRGIFFSLLTSWAVAAPAATWNFDDPCSNKALQCDGTDDFARSVGVTSLPSGNQPYTQECWVKVNQFNDYGGGYNGFILSRGGENWQQGAHIVLLNGNFGLTHWNPDRDTGIAAPLNTWCHIATTYDGATETLYVNGQLRWSAPLSGLNVAVSALTVGRHNNYDNYYLAGDIDEVRIWNLSRTPAQIAANYAARVNPDTPGLVGCWNFDGQDTQIFPDQTVYNHPLVRGASSEPDGSDPAIVSSVCLADALIPVPNNLAGFAVLALHWMETGCADSAWCAGSDLDTSGTVDFDDLALMAQHWLE